MTISNIEPLQDPQPLKEDGRSAGWIKLVFRIGIALWLIIGLFSYFGFSKIVARLTSIDPGYVAVACGILALQYLLSSMRWHYILKREGLTFGFARAFSLFGMGALSNLVLLNAIAGLSVRGVLLVRLGASVSRTLGALLVERLAAVGGMCFCLAIGLAFSFQLLQSRLDGLHLTATQMLLAGGGVLLVAVLAVVLWRFDVIKQFVEQAREAFFAPGVLAMLIVLSTVIVFLGFAGVAALAKGMALEIDPFFFISVMPAVAFVSALPISIGGWGVREGMMVAGLALFSIPPEAAVALSISYGLAGVLVAVILGAIAILIYAMNRPAPIQNESAGDGGNTEQS